MMSPNLPQRVQQEVDMLLKLAEDANPSACLNEFKELESVQHTLPKDEWINSLEFEFKPPYTYVQQYSFDINGSHRIAVGNKKRCDWIEVP